MSTKEWTLYSDGSERLPVEDGPFIRFMMRKAKDLGRPIQESEIVGMVEEWERELEDEE